MTVWALVQSNTVIEITTTSPIGRYPIAVPWIDCTSTPGVGVNWSYSGGVFLPPAGITTASALAALSALLDVKEGLGVQYQASGAAAPSFFSTDGTGLPRLTAAYVAATQSPPLWVNGDYIRTVDYHYVGMTVSDVVQLSTKALAYVRACTANAATLAGLILINPTTDTTVGWPSNL